LLIFPIAAIEEGSAASEPVTSGPAPT
jgi:hypothetical protein